MAGCFWSGAYLKFSSVTHDTPSLLPFARIPRSQVAVGLAWQSGDSIKKYFRKPSIPRSMPRRQGRVCIFPERVPHHFPLGSGKTNKSFSPSFDSLLCTVLYTQHFGSRWQCSRSFQEASSSHERPQRRRLGVYDQRLRGKIRYVTHAART